MAIQKAAAPSTWPDEELILAMMEHEDDYVPMPPVEESTVRVRVKSVAASCVSQFTQATLCIT